MVKKISTEPNSITQKSFKSKMKNILHTYNKIQLGLAKNENISKHCLSEFLKSLQVYQWTSPFDRRVTALAYHPVNPYLLSVGSKSGDIFLWNCPRENGEKQEIFHKGVGITGAINSMLFNKNNPHLLYTASACQVIRHDLENQQHYIYLDTDDINSWYCSLDLNCPRKVITAGDNIGNVKLLTLDGKEIWSLRLHKKKINHTEFSLREDWLLVSASVDKTVKLWDLRYIKNKNSFFQELHHLKPINCATFNLTDGCKLLTNDQYNEIRIYNGPIWTLEQTIKHPHRFYQYITPIKACWHPQENIIAIGRYPDPTFSEYCENEARSVDIINTDTGQIIAHLVDGNAPGIISLNKFNLSGDRLASSMGYSILIWSEEEFIKRKQKRKLSEVHSERGTPSTAPSKPRKSRKNQDDILINYKMSNKKK